MGTAERTFLDEAASFEQTCHTVYLRHFEGLFRRHLWQDGTHAPRQHGLARARNADQQYIMTASCGNFQGSFCLKLPLHIGKVIAENAFLFSSRLRFGRQEPFLTGQKAHKLRKVIQRIDFEPLHQQSLIDIIPSHKHGGKARFLGLYRHGQNPADAPAITFQGQFCRKEVFIQGRGRYQPISRQQSHCNGQIQPGTVLAHIGRCQIDGDFLLPQLDARIADGRPHPLFGFLNQSISQPHNIKAWQARR